MPFRIDPQTGQRIDLDLYGRAIGGNAQTPNTSQGGFNTVQQPQAGSENLVTSFLSAILKPAQQGIKMAELVGREVSSVVDPKVRAVRAKNERGEVLNDKELAILREAAGLDSTGTVLDNLKYTPGEVQDNFGGDTAVQRTTNTLDTTLRTSAGVGSYFVPGGVGAKQIITRGFAGGALDAISSKDTTVTDAVIGGAAGAAGGYIFGDLLPKGLRAVGRKGEDAATALAGSTISASPTQQREFLQTAGETIEKFALDRGLLGRDPKVVQQFIDPLQGAFDDIAINSGNKGSVLDVIDKFGPAIENYKNSTSTQDKAVAKKLERVVDNFIEKFGDSPIDVADFTKERKTFDKFLNNKDFGATTTATTRVANKEARFALQNIVEDITINETLPDGRSLKDLGSELKKLYSFRTIVEKQAGKGKGSSVPFSLLSGGAGGLVGLATAQEDIKNGDYVSAATKIATLYAGGRALNSPKTLRIITNILKRTGGTLSETQSSPIASYTGRRLAASQTGMLRSAKPEIDYKDSDQNKETTENSLNHEQSIPATPFQGKTKQEVLTEGIQSGLSPQDLDQVERIYDKVTASQPRAFVERVATPIKEADSVSPYDKPVFQGYSLNQLEDAMMLAYADGNAEAAKQLQTIYSIAEKRVERESKALNTKATAKDTAKKAVVQLRELFGRGDANNVGTNKDLSLGGGGGVLAESAGKTQGRIRSITDPEYANDLRIFQTQAELALGLFSQAFGSGTPQEAEAKRLLDNMPGAGTSDKVAKAWFDNLEALLNQ